MTTAKLSICLSVAITAATPVSAQERLPYHPDAYTACAELAEYTGRAERQKWQRCLAKEDRAIKSAAGKTMPIDLVGDWCAASPASNKARDYRLPSWMEDGRCTDILSIDKSGFTFTSEKRRCEPVTIRLARSGTQATVTARCRPDGPPTDGEVQTFAFERYKGSLGVTIVEGNSK